MSLDMLNTYKKYVEQKLVRMNYNDELNCVSVTYNLNTDTFNAYNEDPEGVFLCKTTALINYY